MWPLGPRHDAPDACCRRAQESVMIVSRLSRAVLAAVVSGAGIMIVAGCSNAPPPAERADYSQTLNRYYEGRPMCLWPDSVKFPVEDATPDQAAGRGFVALTNAGLLARKPAAKGAPKGSYTFDLTPEGRSAMEPDVFNKGAGNFCYGHRKVSSIDGARQNSRSTELVDYHYNVAQPAAWALEYSIQKAFPQVVGELQGSHKAEATLLDTTDGWQISGTPAIILPVTAEPPASGLAKAKALLHIRQGS
jgi:hypothetical protein